MTLIFLLALAVTTLNVIECEQKTNNKKIFAISGTHLWGTPRLILIDKNKKTDERHFVGALATNFGEQNVAFNDADELLAIPIFIAVERWYVDEVSPPNPEYENFGFNENKEHAFDDVNPQSHPMDFVAGPRLQNNKKHKPAHKTLRNKPKKGFRPPAPVFEHYEDDFPPPSQYSTKDGFGDVNQVPGVQNDHNEYRPNIVAPLQPNQYKGWRPESKFGGHYPVFDKPKDSENHYHTSNADNNKQRPNIVAPLEPNKYEGWSPESQFGGQHSAFDNPKDTENYYYGNNDAFGDKKQASNAEDAEKKYQHNNLTPLQPKKNEGWSPESQFEDWNRDFDRSTDSEAHYHTNKDAFGDKKQASNAEDAKNKYQHNIVAPFQANKNNDLSPESQFGLPESEKNQGKKTVYYQNINYETTNSKSPPPENKYYSQLPFERNFYEKRLSIPGNPERSSKNNNHQISSFRPDSFKAPQFDWHHDGNFDKFGEQLLRQESVCQGKFCKPADHDTYPVFYNAIVSPVPCNGFISEQYTDSDQFLGDAKSYEFADKSYDTPYKQYHNVNGYDQKFEVYEEEPHRPFRDFFFKPKKGGFFHKFLKKHEKQDEKKNHKQHNY